MSKNKPRSLEEATYSAQETDMLGLIYFSAVNENAATPSRNRLKAISDFGDQFLVHTKEHRVAARTCPDKIIYFRRMANFFMKQFDLTTTRRSNKRKKHTLQSSTRGAPTTTTDKQREAHMQAMGIFKLALVYVLHV